MCFEFAYNVLCSYIVISICMQIVQYLNSNVQEWYQHIKTLEADLVAKDQEIDQLDKKVEDLWSKDLEAFTQYSVPDSLEYDIKVRDTSVCICTYRLASNSASIANWGKPQQAPPYEVNSEICLLACLIRHPLYG